MAPGKAVPQAPAKPKVSKARSLYSKMAETRAVNKSPYLRDGKYTLLVRRGVIDDMNDGMTGVAEFLVVTAEKTNPTKEPNAVGTTTSYIEKFDKHKGSLARFKGFLIRLFDKDEAEVTEEEWEELLGGFGEEDGAQIGAGRLIQCEASEGDNKEKTGKVTNKSWTTVPMTEEELETWRAVAKSGKLPEGFAPPEAEAAAE